MPHLARCLLMLNQLTKSDHGQGQNYQSQGHY